MEVVYELSADEGWKSESAKTLRWWGYESKLDGGTKASSMQNEDGNGRPYIC